MYTVASIYIYVYMRNISIHIYLIIYIHINICIASGNVSTYQAIDITGEILLLRLVILDARR